MPGVIATLPKFQFSSNGIPMVGGSLTVYIAGSTTPTTTWQDSALTVANTNPITLDARGECVLWLDESIIYKFVLKNALGVVQWTQDNINSQAPLRSDLSGPLGAALIGANAYQTQDDVNLENISAQRFNAAGNGVTDDSGAFQSLEAAHTGKLVDLANKTYAVSSVPSANIYTNGFFKVVSDVYKAPSFDALLSSTTDTGGIGTAYAGGFKGVETMPGRTTPDLYFLIGSQGSRAYGPSRAGCIASIYSRAGGNLSVNMAARQSNALMPQSTNISTEECEIDTGSRNSNLASVFSRAGGVSSANLASRSCETAGWESANIASDACSAGNGASARFLVNVTNGVITSITVVNQGDGFKIVPRLDITDRYAQGVGAVAVAVMDTVNTDKIASVTVTNGGSGYSEVVGGVDCHAYSGDNQANIASGSSWARGRSSANVASNAAQANGVSSANVASDGVIVNGITSAAMAAASSTVNGTTSAVIATSGSTTSGVNAAVLGGVTSRALADSAVVIGSDGSTASGILSLVLCGNNAQATGSGSIAMGRRIINSVTRSIAFGDASSGEASAANRKFHVFASGAVQAAGTITGSTAFTDYAEYFENAQKGSIALGVLVALDGRKVRPAQPADTLLGVVSATAMIAAGDSPFTWGGRYLTGEFGEALTHEVLDGDWPALVPDPEWTSAPGQTDADRPLIANPTPQPLVTVPMENPDFDPEAVNVPRSQRPDDWTCVGLLGQVHVRVNAMVKPGSGVVAGGNGIGQAGESSRMTCMEIRRPFDAAKGYAVAFCLIR